MKKKIEKDSNKLKRNLTLDILRIIACLFVVISHSNNYVFTDLGPNHNLTFFVTAIYHIISRIAVPIFFMLSGALYLNRETSYKTMLKKAFYRIFIPLLFFSWIIYFKRTPVFSLDNFVKFIHQFLNNEILGTYWFLYALMGLYLGTPLLQKLCKNMNEKDYKMLMIYATIFLAIIPIFRHYGIFSMTTLFSIPLVSTYAVYYMLGNYFFNYEIQLSRKQEKILLVSMILVLLFGAIMTGYDQTNLNMTTYYGEHNVITVFVTSIAFVYFARKLLDNKTYSGKTEKIIILCSGATFGVYLIHALFLGNTKFIYHFLSQTCHINLFLSVVAYQIILTGGLFLLVMIMKKIPVVKKLI